MEIASIKGDTVLLVFHPAESNADVGQQFAILESASLGEGVLVQVISNESLEYAGLQQEQIQRILEQRLASREAPLDQERGMDEIKSLKVATAKIRKRIKGSAWHAWDGWIPSRKVQIARIEASDLLRMILPKSRFPLRSFASFNESDVQFDGGGFNMVSVITGVKGSGKSHVAKHLILGLCEHHVPCIIFDINGEYVQLNNPQVYRWGDTFLPNLAETGPEMLVEIVRSIYPFQPGSPSEAVFEAQLPRLFTERRAHCKAENQPFTIDITYLMTQRWGGGDFVEGAIHSRLEGINRLNLFAKAGGEQKTVSLLKAYEAAVEGRPIVFDMRRLRTSLGQALVRSTINTIERICERETKSRKARYPFVFFEEAHFYISESVILNMITRGRHIGIASVFVTNTPQKLPDTVFRQLDNLFLLNLSHRDDIKNVSKNSFTDEQTVESFATRMPERHAVIVGNITARYPLVVRIHPMPEGVAESGRTRSTWDRFTTGAEVEPQLERGALPAAEESADATVVPEYGGEGHV